MISNIPFLSGVKRKAGLKRVPKCISVKFDDNCRIGIREDGLEIT